MATSRTTRLDIYRWSAGSDPFTRGQMDASHEALEDRVGLFYKGAGTPAATGLTAAAGNDRSLYLDTSTNVLWFSDGSTWRTVQATGTPGSVTPGASASEGVATTLARSDHTHAVPNFGSPVSVGTSNAAGSALTFARSDHVHAISSGAVVAGNIATGAINSSGLFVAGVVDTAALASTAVTREKIATDQRLPVGSLMPFAGGPGVTGAAGSSVPSGWLLCDGSVQTRTSYQALFDVIGTTYNTGGETSLQFRLPDLRGRVAVGKDNMGDIAANRITNTWAKFVGTTLGASGGNQRVQQHNHIIWSQNDYGNGANPYGVGTLTAVSANDNKATQFYGGGNSENVQPSLILNYIIKI